MNTEQHKFDCLVAEWDQAQRNCTETYVAWQAACRHREKLAIDKNNAWGELLMVQPTGTNVAAKERTE